MKNKKIGTGFPVFIVAEIGINHNGSLDIAKKLIDVAKSAGCDVVKFQKRNPELCVPAKVRGRIVETPWGDMSYFDYKKRVEFGNEEFDEIDRYCVERDMMWTASAWDVDSVVFLDRYNVPFHKVPSALLTNDEVLTKMKGTPVFLSTGMSTIEQIDHAVNVLSGEQLVLLHCNSSYPASLNEINLRVIRMLEERYGCPVGYSGHETGLLPSVSAVLLGACVVERHITLDRSMWGTDQAASLEPEGVFRLVRDIRNLSKIVGDGKKRVYLSERPVMEKLRGGGEHKNPIKKVKKPWGYYKTIFADDGSLIKLLCVYAGEELSLQKHADRSEHWIVVYGRGEVVIDSCERLVQPGDYVFVPQGSVHRIRNTEKLSCLLVEVQVGSRFDEDDIIRVADKYGR